MKIRKGEVYLHRQHGVGRVLSVRERGFYGHANAKYVELYFPRDELTVTLLKQDLPNVVRCVITPDEAAALLDHMEAWDKKPQANWKARANAHQMAMDSGDPFEYVKVLKELTRLEVDGPLRASDRAHYNRSLDLLTEELACSLGKTPSRARKLIDRALEASSPID